MNAPDYIAKKFSGYYSRNPISERDVEKREFGIGTWEKKIEMRHLAFASRDELNAKLAKDPAFYISRSAAYYEFPDARPMPKKNWLGADLVFDLDAEQHSCGRFTCAECLAKIKGQTARLVEEFLVPDFGFSRDEIGVNFSGNRGFHVHVRNKDYAPLGREERRGLVDYITGTGLSYEAFFKKDARTKKLFGPKPSDGGYGGKFARKMVASMSDRQFALSLARKLGKPEWSEKFVSGIGEGNWSKVNISGMDEKFRDIFKTLSLKLSDQVDANVTCDISKLIRLPNSLHGGSGLAAIEVKAGGLAEFEPFEKAVVFSDRGEKITTTEKIPKINMKGNEFGPLEKNAQTEVPEFLAVYLICKRAAVPA